MLVSGQLGMLGIGGLFGMPSINGIDGVDGLVGMGGIGPCPMTPRDLKLSRAYSRAALVSAMTLAAIRHRFRY